MKRIPGLIEVCPHDTFQQSKLSTSHLQRRCVGAQVFFPRLYDIVRAWRYVTTIISEQGVMMNLSFSRPLCISAGTSQVLDRPTREYSSERISPQPKTRSYFPKTKSHCHQSSGHRRQMALLSREPLSGDFWGERGFKYRHVF